MNRPSPTTTAFSWFARGCAAALAGLALVSASAQAAPPSDAWSAEDIADLAPLLPRPQGAADDDDLHALAPPLILAQVAERLQLQPGAAIASAGGRLVFTLALAPGTRLQPTQFDIEQWRVDGVPGGHPTIGTVNGTLGAVLDRATATYVAPARIDRPREVNVVAVARFGTHRHKIEVLARVLLSGGPISASVSWDTTMENRQADGTSRGSAPSIDNESSSSELRHRARGAAVFAADDLAGAALQRGERLELYADTGFAIAEAGFLQRGWRHKADAWCDERNSGVQAAQGRIDLPLAASEPKSPRLRLALREGRLMARFDPPTLIVRSSLEDASTYSRRCRQGSPQGNDDHRDATRRDWSHGADHVGLKTDTAVLERQSDGSWLWAGRLSHPLNNERFSQSTSYRIQVRFR